MGLALTKTYLLPRWATLAGVRDSLMSYYYGILCLRIPRAPSVDRTATENNPVKPTPHGTYFIYLFAIRDTRLTMS